MNQEEIIVSAPPATGSWVAQELTTKPLSEEQVWGYTEGEWDKVLNCQWSTE